MSALELMLRRIVRENGNFVSQEKANEVLAELLKLQHQLEIQTKRVENLKKSNDHYAGKIAWKETGKLARSCQAIDQELEKELENLI